MTKKKADLQTAKPKRKLKAPPVDLPEPPPLSDPDGPGAAPAPRGARPSGLFPIVGIGASAGGLGAFEAFFSGMPAGTKPGMAFVLVQHLAPGHKSILTDIIQRCTSMQVLEVTDGMRVQPNCVYIIPPNHNMALLKGALHLLDIEGPRALHLPIDFFFESMAQDLHGRAIGIVLSGTGSDGALGVRAIKGEGGMAMAQNLASSEYDGMPHSALATGLVDYELTPAEMPAQLLAYAFHAFDKDLGDTIPAPKVENALEKIFILLRAQTGHDFSLYKPSSVHRGIERRMAVHQIDGMDGYVKYLLQSRAEVEALFHGLLIGVTGFFRDPEAFRALEEEAIPKLLADKPAGASIRVWTPGCSTGEEAYSIAILLKERIEELNQTFAVQIFATDIDRRAIAAARAGLFPVGSAADLSPERLARFFTAEADGSAYRIHKSLRDMVLFSEHDLIKDPPFSRLDLISCRNLLIYMGAALQKRVIPLFHYALNPDGFLFLGTSETMGDFSELFAVLELKAKLYQSKRESYGAKRASMDRFLTPLAAMEGTGGRGFEKTAERVNVSLRELTEQALLKQFVASGVLVDRHGDILYQHGRTGMYLEPASGVAGVNNILKMARYGLQRELTTALHTAIGIKTVQRHPGLRVKTNGHFTQVDLCVCPVSAGPAGSPDSQLYLVILEEAPPVDLDPAPPAPPQASAGPQGLETDTDARIAALHQELRSKEEYLQTANEELETSNEELKSSNEEMQSVIEELRSTNEELETSKEEMQSVNEELATVNSELRTKVDDLSRASNDMNNLLSSTGIGTIFVDHQLRILRFTPAATRIINLIAGDVGRPVAHIVSNLVGYDGMVADTQAVLDTLVPKDVDVQTLAGAWYSMRIQPYRTRENVIEGAVVTFVDISEVVRTREALRKANDLLRLAVVLRDAHDAITVQDLDGRILAWNPGAMRIYGWTEAEALELNVRSRIPEGLQKKALAKVHQLSQSEILEPYLTQRIAKDGAVLEVSMTSTALLDETGHMYAIATTERARETVQKPKMEAHHGR